MNFKVCPKKPRSQQFSGFSSEMGVANSVVMTQGMAKFTHPDAGSHVAKAWFVPTLHARRP